MAKLKLSPPWCIYAREVEELFRFDDAVHVVYDEEDNVLSLYVDSARKAAALTELMPEEKTFGNVVMRIRVIPANDPAKDIGNPWLAAFEGNGAFAFVKAVRSGLFDLTYVVFRKRVVQYFTDDLGSLYGLKSTLYQTIAQDVFGEVDGVFFTTDTKDPDLNAKYGNPLGEWP